MCRIELVCGELVAVGPVGQRACFHTLVTKKSKNPWIALLGIDDKARKLALNIRASTNRLG